LDPCEIAIPRDFNGVSLAELEDEVRYRKARPGDHLVCPFQCPNCQSQNIRGRDLEPGDLQDEAFECVTIRATLDAFWHRASRTVAQTVTEVNFIVRYSEALDTLRPLPNLGPFKLGEDMGMHAAVLLIMRGMEPGRSEGKTVQFGTARKIRSALTNIYDSSPESGQDLVLSSSSAKGKYVATRNPSEGRWYQYFTMGCCARMGDIISQDRAYTIEVLLKLLAMYETSWLNRGLNIELHELSACMLLLLTCLGGMRGYEGVWTDLAALRYDVEYCEDLDDFSAIAWPIVGRFKAHHGRLGCYMIPIAGTTNSGITFFVWTQRFIRKLALEGVTDGWAFKRSDGTRAKAGDYWEDIASKLEVIQRTTKLIDPAVDVWNDYGVQRSGRRFFTTHCTIMGIAKHVVELQARWQTDRANGERTIQRNMIHTYSEVRNMKEILKRPSQVI